MTFLWYIKSWSEIPSMPLAANHANGSPLTPHVVSVVSPPKRTVVPANQTLRPFFGDTVSFSRPNPAAHCRALTSGIVRRTPTHLNQDEFKTRKLRFPSHYFAFAPFFSSAPSQKCPRWRRHQAQPPAESSSVGGLCVCDGVATLTSYWD